MSKNEENTDNKSLWFKIMEAKRMFSHLPFISTVVLLVLVYIFNVHVAERKMRKIQDMKQDVKEVRWKYVSVHSELMHNTTQSQIADRVKKLDLKWGANRPIVVKAED